MNLEEDNEDHSLPTPLSSKRDGCEDPQLPRASEHSYLPGTSHPLHTSLSENGNSATTGLRQSLRSNPVLMELPILELPGVVLFPGSTFPLRCHEAAWKDYLGRQIASSRNIPGETPPVRIGILTAKPTRAEQTPMDRRRRSWTRQGFGPVRLRRLSQQLIRQLGDLDDLSDRGSSDSGNDEATNNSDGMQVSDDGQESLDSSTSEASLLNVRDTTVAIANNNHHPVAEPSTDTRHDPQRESSFTTNNDRCGYIGRIGTIVTVMNTHGDEADNAVASTVWRPLQDEDELVVTCIATSRFQIANYHSASEEEALYLHQRMRRSGGQFSVNQSTVAVPTFYVEELRDSSLPLPPLGRPFSSLPHQKRSHCQQQDVLLHSLSQITPIPEFVYKEFWPDRLVAQIRECMAGSPTFSGCLEALRASDIDPMNTSFRMASNLPLTHDEKLKLLELYSTSERLRFILEKCQHICRHEQRTEPRIYCKVCTVPLSRARHMFTLAGAEGTTGAYVNEHGCVHQTTTIRQLCDDEENLVYFTGGPETHDSWFPGYSWTIMSCRMCRCHLGWKFQAVSDGRDDNGNAKEDPNRPSAFFGLSAASISIVSPQRRPRNRG